MSLLTEVSKSWHHRNQTQYVNHILISLYNLTRDFISGYITVLIYFVAGHLGNLCPLLFCPLLYGNDFFFQQTTSMTETAAQALMTGQPLRETLNVPIEHLDYEYIRQCSNMKELEKILRVLR